VLGWTVLLYATPRLSDDALGLTFKQCCDAAIVISVLDLRKFCEVFAARRGLTSIDISINRDTGVRRAIYVMNSGIFNNCY
jgi:hypothetical protein